MTSIHTHIYIKYTCIHNIYIHSHIGLGLRLGLYLPSPKMASVGWLVGCFGFNGPLRQYFSLYRAVSEREGEREVKGQMRAKMSKQPPPAPTASAADPCPTVIKIAGRPGTGSLPRPSHHPPTLYYNNNNSEDKHFNKIRFFPLLGLCMTNGAHSGSSLCVYDPLTVSR